MYVILRNQASRKIFAVFIHISMCLVLPLMKKNRTSVLSSYEPNRVNMPLSFSQMFEKVLREVGEMPGTPPAGGPPGMGAPPAAMPGGGMPPPPAGGMPPPGGGVPGADPNQQAKPIEVKASNWIDFMEKALDKLEGKPSADDNTNQQGEQDQEPPPQDAQTQQAPPGPPAGAGTPMPGPSPQQGGMPGLGF